MQYKSTGCQITTVDKTTDKLTGRGGLSFILRYLEKIKFFNLVAETLPETRGSKKAKSAEFMLRQIMAKMIDGTENSLISFDRLKTDTGYAAALEVLPDKLVSSHMVKRFFKKFIGQKYKSYQNLLHKLFVWRLVQERPSVIVLDIDTMVLDNDDAQKRHGVDVTYKNKRGFQPLQITWGGRIVSAFFRRGSAHSNHGSDVQRIVKVLVERIRNGYSRTVPIILTCDSGFLDEKNFKYFEDTLQINYICYGKLYGSVKKQIEKIDSKEYCTYSSQKNRWQYCEFVNKLDSWETGRRTIYTKLENNQQQLMLEFARPDSILYTNLGSDKCQTEYLRESGNVDYLKASKIIELAHGRGVSELTNRSVKDFMCKEQLPFKLFGMNAAYYFVQVISHFLFECYKTDVACDVVSKSSYPTTVRRKLIDFAAKIISTGNRIILQVTESVWHGTKILRLWRRCNAPPTICL